MKEDNDDGLKPESRDSQSDSGVSDVEVCVCLREGGGECV